MSFNYNVDLGHTWKNKWGNMANSSKPASLIIYDSNGTKLFDKTKTIDGVEYQAYTVNLSPGQYSLEVTLPQSYDFDIEWNIKNSANNSMNLSGGAGEHYNFTIGSDGSLTKGSDIGCQAKKSYTFNAVLDGSQTRSADVTLKKDSVVVSTINVTSDKPSKSVTLCLDDGNYSIETDEHINWTLTNKFWTIYPLKANFNASFTLNSKNQYGSTFQNVQQTTFFTSECTADQTSYRIHMIDSGKDHWDSSNKTFLTITDKDNTTTYFHDTYSGDVKGFSEVVKQLCLDNDKDYIIKVDIPKYYGFQISWKITDDDGKELLSGQPGDDFFFHSDTDGTLDHGHDADECVAANTYTLTMTRLSGETGDRTITLNSTEYKLNSSENTKTFNNVCLNREDRNYELQVSDPVAWSLVNKKHTLYPLKSLYDTTFTTQDDTNVFINKNTATPEVDCTGGTKFYVQMSDSGKNHWDSNDNTKLIIKTLEGTEVFNDAYTSHFVGFDSIVKEVCLPDGDYTISCGSPQFYDFEISWGIYSSTDYTEANKKISGGANYSKQFTVSVGNITNLVDVECVHQLFYNVRLFNPTEDNDYTLELRKNGQPLKTFHLPKGEREHSENICLDPANYTVHLNYQDKVSYEIKNMRFHLDALTFQSDFSFVINGSGNSGKGEITQPTQIFLVSEKPEATPTMPPPPPTLPPASEEPETPADPETPAAPETPAPKTPLVPAPEKPKTSYVTYLMIALGVIFVVFIVLIIMKKSKSSHPVMPAYGYYPSSVSSPYQMSATPR